MSGGDWWWNSWNEGDGWNNDGDQTGRASGSDGGRGRGQPKKKAKAKAQQAPARGEEEMSSRQRREESRAPALQEMRELRGEVAQQAFELRVEATQRRELRDEASVVRSEYVAGVSEEAALKTVLKMQQNMNEVSANQVLKLQTEYSSVLESQQRDKQELEEVEASRRVHQLSQSSLRRMRTGQERIQVVSRSLTHEEASSEAIKIV